MFYTSHYVINKKLHAFSSKHDSNKIVCRRLNSYSRQSVLLKQKQVCKQQEITAIKRWKESQLYWKKYFHKKLLCFRIYIEFEADKEIDDSDKRKKQHIYMYIYIYIYTCLEILLHRLINFWNKTKLFLVRSSLPTGGSSFWPKCSGTIT